MEKIKKENLPRRLLETPEPPDGLYIRGTLPPPETKLLCVVGSRNCTQYGKDICERLMAALHGRNVAIVSGLALGIDVIAHKAALEHGILTVAIPGSGLDPNVLYPANNRRVAEKILDAGGCLLSEFEPDFIATPWAFPQRNRIMAGLSEAVLIIEAEMKSGTLITAKLAADYNRDVLAVPGSVLSRNSEGPHHLIREGATPVTCGNDLLEALGFEREAEGAKSYRDCSVDELKIIELLKGPKNRDRLMQEIGLAASEVNILLSSLELKGHIIQYLGLVRRAD
jgi:DNA processing protein